MKQHITKTQLDRLSEKGKKKLMTWLDGQRTRGVISENGWIYSKDFPLLSIGQMIEFLLDKIKYLNWEIDMWEVEVDDMKHHAYNDYELCDTLWQATKEVLEK